MPNARTKKDGRQYEYVSESELKQGAEGSPAEEIAGRAVSKQQREEGRTLHKRRRGTGNPNRPLEEHTRDELYNRAKTLGIAGRGRMSKDALIMAIREQAQAPRPKPARDAPATSYISMRQQ